MPLDLEFAERVKKLPPYIFAEIEALKAKKKAEGVDLIPLGIGDPDIPTPKLIVDALKEEVEKPENHQYPTSMGEPDFREAVARWYKVRFGVDLDPDTQVTNLIGGKEGVANIARAFVNPGDVVLCPNPGYPVYANGATVFSEGVPYLMPLEAENDFLPDLDAIPDDVVRKAKMMYLNYPNNPTGAIAPVEYLERAVQFAEENNILIVYDNPYSEFTFGDYNAPSLLQIAPEHVEINSCSKMFNMTGYRVAWAVGGERAVTGLKKVKSQVDSGAPTFIQRAAIRGLELYKGREKPDLVARNMEIYERRRDVLVDGLNAIGWETPKPRATFYVWTKSPDPDSMRFCMKLIEEGVVITPGVGFGKYGEGYVRFALTQPEDRIREALSRIESVLSRT
ncbi:MAG: LL-diaminopimelate aminotransferase [Promethearchaeota archaeon]